MASLVRREIQESIAVKEKLLDGIADAIAEIASVILHTLRGGNKVLLFGNGGSAADAQHIAAELVGRYQTDRKALPAIALTTDTSILTAVGNDYGFEEIFARQISALGAAGDVALAISTSGNSPNVLAGLRAAKRVGMKTIGFTGGNGGAMKELVDHCLLVPSEKTARIQEAHILAGHIITFVVERALLDHDGFRIRRPTPLGFPRGKGQ
jgi:D-sedoheptulose 7-phosphate isomerase